MFLSVARIIKWVLDMLKGNLKLTNRRLIVARSATTRTEDLEAAEDDIAEPQQIDSQPTKGQFAIYRRDTLLSGMPRSVERDDGGLQTYSPNHFLKRTKFRHRSTPRTAPANELTFHAVFHQRWRHQDVIGEGGDGTVHLYRRHEEGLYVAVKVPLNCSSREDVEKEIINMRLIGKHDHILHLVHASKEWSPYGPAMFMPYCELGSVIDYRQAWCKQQAWDGQPERIPEITMWKLFGDMVLALNFLHNELGVRYVHNDFKPANILAEFPPNQIEYQMLPEQPTFKLSDFARLTPWPTPKGKPGQSYDGTPEYAPPKHEQRAPVQPSADIWGLGATLQYMALGIVPTQSKKAFIRSRKEKGLPYPELEDRFAWASEYWRTRIPTFFRPINVPVEILQKDYDLTRDLPDYQQYGARLGYWYAQLWKPVGNRPKASKLVAQAIPQMNNIVERLKLERLKQMGRCQEYDEVCQVR